jgi:hypothetical protein
MPADFSIVDLLDKLAGAAYRAANKMLRISHCFGSASRSACNHCRASRWKAIRPGNHFESIIASAGYMHRSTKCPTILSSGHFSASCLSVHVLFRNPLTGFLLLHSNVKNPVRGVQKYCNDIAQCILNLVLY